MNIQRSPSGSSVNQLQGNNPNGNPQNPPNRTTSMGPPLSANPINQNQNINFQIALNQQQNRNSSISPNASNHLSLSLPGAGMLRMLQYAEGLSTGIQVSFLPGVAIQRRKVSQKIPLDVIDKIRKDVENEVSGRKIKGESEDDKNKNDPDGDGKKMKKDNRPDTPASSKRSDGNQDDKSLEEKDEKDADGGIKNESPNSSQRTDRNDENEIGSSYTIMVDQTFLPESPVNEYGITLRAMRCLEVSTLLKVCDSQGTILTHTFSRLLVFLNLLDHRKRLSVERPHRSFTL
jgi:hypothetical protein